jgi:hypothetical protein
MPAACDGDAVNVEMMPELLTGTADSVDPVYYCDRFYSALSGP